MTMEFCQRVFYEKGMPHEWQTSALVPIFSAKGDVKSCNVYRGEKL